MERVLRGAVGTGLGPGGPAFVWSGGRVGLLLAGPAPLRRRRETHAAEMRLAEVLRDLGDLLFRGVGVELARLLLEAGLGGSAPGGGTGGAIGGVGPADLGAELGAKPALFVVHLSPSLSLSVSANTDTVGVKRAFRCTPTCSARRVACGAGSGLVGRSRVILLIVLLLMPVAAERLRTVWRLPPLSGHLIKRARSLPSLRR